MKLELPDNHPLAKAIRDNITEEHGRLLLSLDHFGPSGFKRIFVMAIDEFTVTETRTKSFECRLTDLGDERRQLEGLIQWPKP
jgi:hypothetical protein